MIQISHEELHEKTIAAARHEKSATLALLEFLMQVEDRRTYAVLGSSSLFEYVVDQLGYSPSQASERIGAMRLLRKVPEVADHLTEGEHSLTSLVKLASHVRRENLTPVQAQALVEATANRSIVQIEKHLFSVAEVEPPKLERKKVISKELTRLTLDVDEEFMASLTRVRELKGNPALSLSDAFLIAMREFIAKREPKAAAPEPSSKPADHHANPAENTQVLRTTELAPRKRSRYIRVNDRRIIRTRSRGECEYVHGPTGKRCGSRVGLQFEHTTPFAKGGLNHAQNLKHYCPAHNRLAAIEAYGVQTMGRYLRR